jgi:type VI secretion system protein ImpE
MNPRELLKAGKLNDAVAALGEELRRDPTDLRARTFLFELLCFQGNHERAAKQIDVLGQEGPQSEMGAVLYRGLLHAMKSRQDVFLDENIPITVSRTGLADNPGGGSLNGVPFESIEDADPRIGMNLEVFAAGAYFLIPFSCLASIEISPPRRLRDLLWIPAVIHTTPAFQGRELGEAFLPALSPLAWMNASDSVRLGRETVWEDGNNGARYPVGQKVLLVDDEEIPILEVRKLEFAVPAPAG